MKVVVDHNLCEGNGRCAEVAPDVFELRDDDRSHVLIDSPAPAQQARIDLAVSLCPRQAIRRLTE